MQLRKATRQAAKLKIGFSAVSGAGKAQPFYSKVLTDLGFVEMKDINVGTNVFTANGTLTKVINVFPQGKKKIWEFTLSDGTKVQSCEEHLWKTSTISERVNNLNKKGSIKTTLEIVNSLKKGKKANHFIELCNPIQFNKKEFIISPYIMGILLGDGCFRSESLFFSSVDSEIATNVNSLLPTGLQLKKRGINYIISRELLNESQNKNPFIEELKFLNLMDKSSFNKFIPFDYLHSSIEDRIELLQGLIDTDGSVYNEGQIEYTTTSYQLKEDVKFLVESLGGYCSSIKERKTKYIYKEEVKEGKLSYRLKIILPNTIIPCKLQRKLDRVSFYTKYLPIRNIVEALYIGEVEAQCIEVEDNSHLYITDNFIVTHNTFGALKVAYGLIGDWSKIAVIDTENGSADLYSHLGDYNVLTLNSYSPEKYIEAIIACEKAGMELIIIDSTTHEWEFLLQVHAKMEGNSYANWSKITPRHDAFKNKILQSPCHIFTTVRRKTEYEMQNIGGKTSVVKLGTAEVQRSGFEYELTINFEINESHLAKAGKDRTGLFTNRDEFQLNETIGEELKNWCTSGNSDTETLLQIGLVDINNCSSLTELSNVFNKHVSLQLNPVFKEAASTKKKEFIKE